MEDKKKQAIYELDDELSEIKRNITNAGYMMQDIMEDFFEHFDPKKRDEIILMAHEFPRYAAKASILQDILFKIEAIMKQLPVEE